MPDHRKHRGAHPEDAELFAPRWLAALQSATADLSWLLSRGYASPSAIKVVGDRYNLSARQRIAIMRSACGDAETHARRARELTPGHLAGQAVLVDGYNVLTTIEAALAGGVILIGRDNAWRDLASMHGTWRRVEETVPAIFLAASALQMIGVAQAVWLLDQPVSNSGRLKQAIEEIVTRQRWPWQVSVVPDPDKILWDSDRARALLQPSIATTPPKPTELSVGASPIVITSDSAILDRCGPWFGLARHVVSQIPPAWILDLST